MIFKNRYYCFCKDADDAITCVTLITLDCEGDSMFIFRMQKWAKKSLCGNGFSNQKRYILPHLLISKN